MLLTSASNNKFVLKKNQLKVAWKRILCAANKKMETNGTTERK